MIVEFACGGAVLRVLEDGGKAALEFPRGEEERPVDVGHDIFELYVVQHVRAGEGGRGNDVGSPVEPRRLTFAASHVISGRRSHRGVLLADAFLIGAILASTNAGRWAGLSRLENDIHSA